MRGRVAVLIVLIIWLGASSSALAVQLFIEANPTTVTPEGLMMINLTVSNEGPGDITNVELRLEYPDDLDWTPLSDISKGGSANIVQCTQSGMNDNACEPGETIIWDLNTIPAGEGVTVSLPPEVEHDATGSIEFQAEVRVNGTLEAVANRNVVVDSAPFFQLLIDETREPSMTPGEHEYILTYSNTGGSATGAKLRFPLPQGTTFLSATDGGGLSGGDVLWNLGNLTKGSGGEQRVSVWVGGSAGELVEVDPVSISGFDAGNVAHEVLSQGVTRIENGVYPNLALSVAPHSAKINEQLQIELTVTNPTTASLSDVKLFLRYPDHLDWTYLSDINTGGSANTVECDGSGQNAQACEPGEMVVWNLNTILTGEGVTVSLPPKVWHNVADGTLIQFQAEVWAGGVQQVTGSRSIKVSSAPFFGLIVDEANDPTMTTGEHEFILTYGNTGGAATGTELRFPLPEGTTFLDATEGGEVSEGDVVWNLGNLTAGAGGEQRVLVELSRSGGDILEVDPVSIIGTDSNNIEHRFLSQGVTRIKNGVHPNLALSVTPHSTESSEQLQVELTVTNPTTASLSDVKLILRYPDHLDWTYLSNINTGGSANTVECAGSGQNAQACEPGEMVVWNLNTILTGEGVTVNLPPKVRHNVADGTLIQFQAEVWASGQQDILVQQTAHVGTKFLEGSYKVDPPGFDSKTWFPVRAKNGNMIIICM